MKFLLGPFAYFQKVCWLRFREDGKGKGYKIKAFPPSKPFSEPWEWYMYLHLLHFDGNMEPMGKKSLKKTDPIIPFLKRPQGPAARAIFSSLQSFTTRGSLSGNLADQQVSKALRSCFEKNRFDHDGSMGHERYIYLRIYH